MPRDPQVTGRILFSGGTGSQLASGRQTYPSGPRDLHTTRCPSGRRRTDRRIDRDLDLHNRTGSDRPALAARLAHRRRQSRSRPSSPSTSLTKGVSSPGWAAKRNWTSHACSGRWRSRSATVEHDEHTSPASSPARPLACVRQWPQAASSPGGGAGGRTDARSFLFHSVWVRCLSVWVRCLAVDPETIPRSANRLDHGPAELAAQVAHVHVDEVRSGIEVHAPGHGQ